MSQTLQNQITYAKSMNGIVQLSDGQGTIIQNGTIVSNDISGTNITTSNLNTTDLILPRKSTAALNTLLGSTIDVDQLIQNLRFSSRTFEIWNDTATGQILGVDCSNNVFYVNCETLNLTAFTSLVFDCSNTSFNNSNVSFSNSNVSFNSFLPTSTLTPTTGTQLITKTFADTTYAPAGSYALLNASNSFTEQNIFRKGILPCRGTGTNPESDIQLGGNNQLQYRQATSANNISIGQLTLQGDGTAGWTQYNTGSRNIGIGHNVLERLDLGNDNIFVGYQAGKNCGSARIHGVGVTPQRCIAIGTFSQLGNLYMADSISIGYNSLKNASGPAAGNIMMGSNVGNGLTFQGNCTFIGTNCAPTVNDNAITAIGYQALGAATNQFNSGTAIGWQAGYNNNNGQGGTFIGAEAGFTNTSGSYNTCIGLKAGRPSGATLNTTICIGYNSGAVINNECVFGGNTATEQVLLTLPQKNRINCCQIIGSVATYNIAWRSNEYIIVNTATTTTITLPQATDTTAIHVGACFNIIRTNASTPTITIQAFGTEKINYSGSVVTSFTIANFIQSISLCCIDYVSGNTLWSVCNYNDRVTTSTNSTNATNATNATITDQTATNANYYLNFTSAVTGNQGVNASSNFIFNPATQLLNLDAGTFQLGKIRPTAFQYFNIPALQTAAFTITNPMYSYYPFMMKTTAGYTVTMPIVEAANVGHQLTFKRIGGSLQALTMTMNSNQPIFLSGNAVGTTTSPSTIISATQSSTTIVATQTGDSGTGTFTNTAGSTTVTIVTQTSGTLTIGHSVNFNGNVRYITAYGTGLGGTGTYTVNTAIAGANTNQPYTASVTYGWAVVSVS